MTAPRALFFDTFGTVVEWRTCVTKALTTAAQQALESGRDFPADVRGHQHHYSALQDLLSQQGILELFTDSELRSLTFAWHRLDPWADSVPGLNLLNKRFITSTLSNGNVTLLEDLQRHGSLPFTHITSAENFGAYKPSPLVYNGAAKLLGLEASQCAMVAAHLSDLQAAKSCGFQTIYVERHFEEAWSADEVEQAKKDGFVDHWVDLNIGGLSRGGSAARG
ncbi:hypothetical protein N7448_004024 [Penicillium atrosanguineum]|nr:hypothetical protein N7448_004024 [Penicillium atrosanguineum]